MSKKTKTYDPSASITINGMQKSSVKTKKGGTNVTYNMNPYEKAAYEYAQKSFNENLSNINVFSDETVKNLKNQLDAYKNRGIDLINQTYSPMIKDVQNDSARRFGNIDNSIFLDNLKTIEAQRSSAVNEFAQDVTSKQNELVNDELTNRYKYLAFLNDYQNSVYDNMLNTLAMNQNFLNSNQNYQNSLNNRNSSSNNLFNYVNLASKFLF